MTEAAISSGQNPSSDTGSYDGDEEESTAVEQLPLTELEHLREESACDTADPTCDFTLRVT